MFIFVPFIVLGLIIIIAIAAIPAFRLKRAEFKKTGKHPKGYYMNQGIALGMVIGIMIGIGMDNIGAGIAIGIAIGAGIGSTQEKKHKDELRPMTEKETSMNKYSVIAGVGLLFVGLLLLMGIYYFKPNKTVDAVDIVTNFTECIDAGNPAMESYPRQCRHGDRTYTEVIDNLIEVE